MEMFTFYEYVVKLTDGIKTNKNIYIYIYNFQLLVFVKNIEN